MWLASWGYMLLYRYEKAYWVRRTVCGFVHETRRVVGPSRQHGPSTSLTNATASIMLAVAGETPVCSWRLMCPRRESLDSAQVRCALYHNPSRQNQQIIDANMYSSAHWLSMLLIINRTLLQSVYIRISNLCSWGVSLCIRWCWLWSLLLQHINCIDCNIL